MRRSTQDLGAGIARDLGADMGHVARGHARRVAMVLTGSILLVLGGGFVLAAFWLALAAQFGPLMAHVALAALLIGLGLLVIGLAPRPPRLIPLRERIDAAARAQAADRNPTGALGPLIEAFIFGLGLAARLRGKKP